MTSIKLTWYGRGICHGHDQSSCEYVGGDRVHDDEYHGLPGEMIKEMYNFSQPQLF